MVNLVDRHPVGSFVKYLTKLPTGCRSTRLIKYHWNTNYPPPTRDACTHDAPVDSVSVSLAHSPAPSAANADDKTTARIYNDDA